MENITITENKISIPLILEQIINTISKLYPNISKEIITNTLLVKCFQMFAAKRIIFDESGRTKIPNWFALILLQSGGGKDRLLNTIDDVVLKDYHDWFQEKANSILEAPEQPLNEEQKQTSEEQGEIKNDKNPF